MNAINLSTKRRWSWKAFFMLVGLNILALAAYKLYRSSQSGANAPLDWASIMMMMLEYLACIIVGLFLGKRIGLGLPFVENWGKHQPGSINFRKIVALAWIIGVAVGVSLLLLSEVIFGPPMKTLFKELELAYPNAIEMLPLPGIMASFYAGVTEETVCRLGGLTLIVWLGGLLFHRPDGRPRLGIFWLANILVALFFGFGHLQTAAGLGWPLNPLVITRGLLINGIAGLVFGWLYWKYGFESAILAHFFTDVIAQVVNPYITRWQGESAGTAVLAGVVVAILLTLVGAVRSLKATNRKTSLSGSVKAV